MTGSVQVCTTIDSKDAAVALARSAVEARLAACAQIDGPITSAYWWDAAVRTDQEWRVTLKTTDERYAALEAHILANHSYDTPEVIATPITHASPAYLTWLTTETTAMR